MMYDLTIDEIIAKAKLATNMELNEFYAKKILEDAEYVEIYRKVVYRYDRLNRLKNTNAPDLIIKNEEKIYKEAIFKFDEMICQIHLADN